MFLLSFNRKRKNVRFIVPVCTFLIRVFCTAPVLFFFFYRQVEPYTKFDLDGKLRAAD